MAATALRRIPGPCAAVAAALLAWSCAALPAATQNAPPSVHARFGHEHPSAPAREVADWIVSTGDNRGANFIVVDKVAARAYVFRPDGRLRGASAVLLGLARGDDSTPGIGDKKLSEIRTGERTTPAGRFIAERGKNAHGAPVVWVDYDAAVSMHKVIAGTPAERRRQRLASPTPADNRISYGCINVPPGFFEHVLRPIVERGTAVIYILPETRPASVQFGYARTRPSAAASASTRAGGA